MPSRDPKKIVSAVAAAAFLCLLTGRAAAQEFQSYPVKGYPELTRNYSRFSNTSVIFTEGYSVRIRRRQSGLVPATLKVILSFQGADSNTKSVGIGVVGAKSVEAGDIDVGASGTHSWVIVDDKVRTQYENNRPLAKASVTGCGSQQFSG
jgi:hypothetical protein